MANDFEMLLRLLVDKQSLNQSRQDLNQFFSGIETNLRKMEGALGGGGGASMGGGGGGGGGQPPRRAAHPSHQPGGRFGGIPGFFGVRAMLGGGPVGGFAAGVLGYGAAGGALAIGGQMLSQVNVARSQEQALSDLNRRLGESIALYNRWSGAVLASGAVVGASRDQVISLASTLATVGRGSPAKFAADLQMGMGLSKTLGIAPESTIGFYGSMGRLMQGPGTNNAALSGMLYNSASGGMRGREDEVVKAIEELTALVGQRLPEVTPGNAAAVFGLMDAFNQTGIQGLMGQRGAQQIGSLNNIITGGGPGGALMLASIASQQKGPFNYADLLYQQAEGVGNSQNPQAFLSLVQKLFPGDKRQQSAMAAQIWGGSPQQMEAMLKGINGAGSAKGGTVPATVLTEQDKYTKAVNEFSNSMQKMAVEILPAATHALDAFTGLIGGLTGILSAIAKIPGMDMIGAVAVQVLTAMAAIKLLTGAIGMLAGAAGLAAKIVGGGGGGAAAAAAAGGAGGAAQMTMPWGAAAAAAGGNSLVSKLAKGAKMGGLLSAIPTALDVGQTALSGGDWQHALGRGIFSILGGIGGGALGSLAGPVGTIGGGMLGAYGGGSLFDALFPTSSAVTQSGTSGGGGAASGGGGGGGFNGMNDIPGMAKALQASLGAKLGMGGGNAWQAFAAQMQHELGNYASSRGRLNNNPLNLKALGGGQMWPGQTGTDSGGFAIFSSTQAGIDAAAQNYMAGSYKGVQAAFATGDANAVANAIQSSPWDAGHYGGMLPQETARGYGQTALTGEATITIVNQGGDTVGKGKVPLSPRNRNLLTAPYGA